MSDKKIPPRSIVQAISWEGVPSFHMVGVYVDDGRYRSVVTADGTCFRIPHDAIVCTRDLKEEPAPAPEPASEPEPVKEEKSAFPAPPPPAPLPGSLLNKKSRSRKR